VDKSMAFYTDKMGFTAGAKVTGPDGKTIAGEIHFGKTHLLLQTMCFGGSSDYIQTSLPEIHILVDQETNMERLYTQMRMRGVMMYHDLQDERWGERTFGAKDPNGYQLRFARKSRVRTFESRHAAAS
jgi:uncharacterized glyoxalase superfamily protein PhnB